jgi:predicted metalloprotease with PDZ domain
MKGSPNTWVKSSRRAAGSPPIGSSSTPSPKRQRRSTTKRAAPGVLSKIPRSRPRCSTARAPITGDLRRSVDYYEEGTLIWLDADVTIRTLSKGKKSLDDFCKLWAGGSDTTDVPTVKPYTFDDVVTTLNATQPYDWAGFLNERLQSTAPHAPLNGIVNSGYNLVYTAERSDYRKSYEAVRKGISLAYSIGLSVRDGGDIVDVHLNSPAYKAGLAPASRIIAVNGREYSGAALRRAIADAVKDPAPIVLIVKDGDYYKTVSIDYHGGEKYPHLVRDKSKPDLLSDILKAK